MKSPPPTAPTSSSRQPTASPPLPAKARSKTARQTGRRPPGLRPLRLRVETGELTNLSVDTDPANPKGAVVQGALAVSDDGSSVYFAARGQLVPGEGPDLCPEHLRRGIGQHLPRPRRESSPTWRRSAAECLPLPSDLLIRDRRQSEATPDGEHLLFQTRANLTADDSPGVQEAYLYSAEAGTIVCVSCRPDGQPSVGGSATNPLGRLQPHPCTDYGASLQDERRRQPGLLHDARRPRPRRHQRHTRTSTSGRGAASTCCSPGRPPGILSTGQNTRSTAPAASGDDVFIRTTQQ